MLPLSQIFVPLHRIIPFSNVEGVGNRTSIFLQGCKLNCLYCHNPETIARYADGAKLVSLQYLFDEVINAAPFIRGVTISGGEPTIHHKKLVPLFRALRAQGLTCYLDSSGFFDFEATRELIEVTDKFLFDLKGIGEGLQTLCFDRQNRAGIVREIIPTTRKLNEKNALRNAGNLTRLLALDKVEEVRLVYLLDFFDAFELVNQTAQILQNYPDVLFKIIRVHSQGVRDPKGLAPFVPTIAQTKALENYAKEWGITRIKTIF